MGFNNAGDHRPTLQIEDLSEATSQASNLLTGSQLHDDVVLEGDGLIDIPHNGRIGGIIHAHDLSV